jgi:hypothetical protein
MPRSPRSRKTASLSQLTHNRLNMYAFAAGAAGVGLLALDVPAEGRVVYTPDNQMIGLNGGLSLDLNHDGITDFVFSNYFSSSFSHLGIAPVNRSNEIFSTGGSSLPVFAAALPAGKKIGPAGKFQKAKSHSDEMVIAGCQGPWVHAREKYRGLKFIIEGEVHFGWARLNVNCDSPIKARLTGYAYETVADEPIVAGDKMGAEASVETGTLGSLALGAAATPNK